MRSEERKKKLVSHWVEMDVLGKIRSQSFWVTVAVIVLNMPFGAYGLRPVSRQFPLKERKKKVLFLKVPQWEKALFSPARADGSSPVSNFLVGPRSANLNFRHWNFGP